MIIWALSLILISAKFNLTEEDRHSAAVSDEFAASNNIAPPGKRSLASQAGGDVASKVSN
jgi:hypothetical protein